MKNKNPKPLVSVIMPVYNAEAFLVKAIESILNQTYQNFELIIINDHSADNSWKIIKKYKDKYPKKIKAINLKKNLNRGGDACANVGLKYARGKYIARMDADDIAHPQRIKKQVIFLEKNPQIFLVGTNANVIDEKDQKIGQKNVPLDHQSILNSFFIFNPIIHPSVMFRRFKGKKRFFYPIRFSANNDYYAFFRLIVSGYKFANLKEKLLFFRIHKKNDTFTKIKEKFLNVLKIRLLMVFKFNYKPSLKQWFIFFTQIITVLFFPEFIIKNIYLYLKIIDKNKLYGSLKKISLEKINHPFSRIFLFRLRLIK